MRIAFHKLRELCQGAPNLKTACPVVFACSGCSNAGQLVNRVALELDRRGIAEMSCLAGVGAAKPFFLKKLNEREVWIIDGCPIHCSLGVFDQVNQFADVHIRLHDIGIKKNSQQPNGEAFEILMSAVLQQVEAGRNSG